MPNVFNITCVRCGKLLMVDEINAGKTRVCPNCRGIINIPTREKLQPIEASKGVKKCPTCGAYLNPGDVICISCYTNLATGEWDMEKSGYRPEKNSYPLLKIAGVLFIGLSLFILVSLMTQRVEKKVVKESNKINTDGIKGDTKNLKEKEYEAAAEKERLEKISENSLEEIRQKIDTYKKYIENYKVVQLPNMAFSLRRLKDKESELLADQYYKKLESQLKGMDPFADLLTILSFSTQFQDNKYYKRVQESKNKILGEISSSLDSYKSNAQELLKKKQYNELLCKLFPKLFKSMTSMLAYSEIKEAMDGFFELSLDLEKNLEEASTVSIDHIDKENMLALVKKDYESYDKYFYMDSMEQREYPIVKKYLGEFLAKIQPLLDNPEKDTVYQDVKAKLDDLDKIEKLFGYAVRGAEKNKGKDFIFWIPRDARVVKGVIAKCEAQNICVVNENKVELVSVTDLRPEDVVNFAQYSEKGKDIHFISTVFLIYEGKFSLASEEVKKAQKEGADYKEVLLYNEIISKAENEYKHKISTHINPDEARVEQRKEQIRKRLMSKVTELTNKIYISFKAKENRRVFELLEVIKQKQLNKDDIKKVDDEFKKITGYYLGDIAEICLTECSYCKNKGKVKCPTCDGYFKVIVRGSGSKKRVEQVREEGCPDCNSKGEVDCEYCKSNRTPTNQILVSYFQNIKR